MSARVRVQRNSGPGFVAVPNDFARVGPEVDVYTFRLLVFLAAEADGRLVHSTDVAARFGWSVNTYKRRLAAAEAAGYVRRTATGERDKYGKQVVELLVNLSGVTPALSPDDSAHCPQVTTKKINEEDQSLSRLVSKKRTAQPKQPQPLPDDWKPSHTHKATAQKNGWDLDLLVDEFLYTDAAVHGQRADWDKTFGKFCRQFTAGTCYWETA